MISKGVGFARYSKSLCWVVAFIWLTMAVLSFAGDSGNAVLNGFLWLAGAIAFAVSAMFLGRAGAESGAGSEAGASDDQAG
ncbi:MAG: hypothetical protein RL120_16745 [Gammaproteobacteria bacterium]